MLDAYRFETGRVLRECLQSKKCHHMGALAKIAITIAKQGEVDNFTKYYRLRAILPLVWLL